MVRVCLEITKSDCYYHWKSRQCRNPNVVLQSCYEALKPNGKIVLEGRYEPVSYSDGLTLIIIDF